MRIHFTSVLCTLLFIPLFTTAQTPTTPLNLTGISENGKKSEDVVLLQNRPNPYDDATWLSVAVNKKINCKESYIRIVDITGKEIVKLPIQLNMGVNDILFEHGMPVAGTYLYSLVIDGKLIDTKSLIFAN